MNPRVSDRIPLLDTAGMHATVSNTDAKTMVVVSIPNGRFRSLVHFTMSHESRDLFASALLDWRYVADEMPDADTALLLSFDDGETAQGFWDGENWCLPNGAVFVFAPYAWAHMPSPAPMKAATLKPLRVRSVVGKAAHA